MTDLPYTDADLRHEAARQLKNTTEDADFVGIGEQMTGTVIHSRQGQPRACWHDLDDLNGDAFGDAQRAIDDLLSKAADLSEWAVTLGADGLTPDGHHADFGHHPSDTGPLMRLHFAFHPEADGTDRHALAQLVTEAVQDALNAALKD